MPEYDVSRYGERWADAYDDFYADRADQDACVEFLRAAAGTGAALELGIGTGRVGLPLAAQGAAVVGIEASPSMIAKLREKPGGKDIAIHQGDFASFSLGRKFSLVYVVFNTIFYLAGQDEQVSCFKSAAEHLDHGGAFVVEATVPGLGSNVQVADVDSDQCTLYVPERDPVTQRIVAQFVRFSVDGRVQLLPDVKRYAWPSELDLMARIAGLVRTQRWGGWCREPFTASSTKHISLYEARERG
jgi:SAM-dependent methyltransferase